MSGPKSTDKSISETFTKNAGEEYEEEVTLEGNVNATAKAQLDNQKALEASLRSHNMKRYAAKQNFAAGDVPVPTMDIGPNSRGNRDLAGEYQAIMDQLDREREGIEVEHTNSHYAVRDEGTTLSDAFDGAQQENSDPLNDQINTLETQRDALSEQHGKLNGIEQETNIAKKANPNDMEVFAGSETQVETIYKDTETLFESIDENDIQSGAENESLIDEWQNSAFYKVTSPDVENDLPLDMKAAINEDSEKSWLNDEYLDETLDFSATDEWSLVNDDQAVSNDVGRSRD